MNVHGHFKDTLWYSKKNLNPNLGTENSLYFYIFQREKPGSQGK